MLQEKVFRDLFFVGIGVILYLYGCDNKNWNNTKIEQTKKIAIPIIQALEKYKKENSRPASNLNELVPKYIKTIPKPPLGYQKWDYYLSGDDYNLGVTSYYDPNDSETTYWLRYASSTHKWYRGAVGKHECEDK